MKRFDFLANNVSQPARLFQIRWKRSRSIVIFLYASASCHIVFFQVLYFFLSVEEHTTPIFTGSTWLNLVDTVRLCYKFAAQQKLKNLLLLMDEQ